jgi:hypothetical protein
LFVASYQGFGFGISDQSIYGRFRSAIINASISNPCGDALPDFAASYNFSLCQSLLRSVDLLKTAVFCRSPPCTVNGMFTPRFDSSSDLVLSGYPYELASFFMGNVSMPIRATLEQILGAAQSFCNGPSSAADMVFNARGVKSTWQARSTASFGAAWLEEFTQSLGIAAKTRLVFTAERCLAQGLLLQRKVFPAARNATEAAYSANCTRMAVVIDAGSSASKAKVFRWLESEGLPIGAMPLTALDTALVKVKPGVASPSLSVDQAVATIVNLMLQVDEFVPAAMRSTTPVHVVATGGVRNLLTTDPLKAAAIFEGIRVALSKGTYLSHPSFVTWLSGEQEGAYAWLAARSLLNPEHPNTEVITVEVGGATLQIAIEDKQTSVLSSYFALNGVYGKKIELFSHSWNLFGRDEALRLHRELLLASTPGHEVPDPCQWTGFTFQGADNRTIIGKANMTACLAQVRAALLVAQTTDPAAECELPRCFAAVHLPSVSPLASLQLLGIFRNVAEFFGLSGDVHANRPVVTSEWWANAITMCDNIPYADLLVVGPQVNDSAIDKPLDTYCHTAAQAYAIIVDLLKADPGKAQDVSEMSEKISWALGYLIFYLQSPTALRPSFCPQVGNAESDPDFLFWIYVGAGATAAFIALLLLVIYLKRKLKFRMGREQMLSVQDQLAVN